jgi:hypothetical protein
MKKKIVAILVCMFMLSTVAGSIPSTNTSTKPSENETEPSEMGYSHNILSEFFTLTTCVPCKYSHRALIYIYENKTEWDKPFYYTTMVYDKDVGNKWANTRHNELEVTKSPTTCWDGPFRADVGSDEDIEEDMADFNTSIITCGNRNVKDIDLNLDVEWLGAVNIDPYDGETLVPIEQTLTWTNSEMEIDIEVINNESDEYNGHLHVYVTEVDSTLWDDKWGDPYTFAFLDYAWNEDVTISASSSWDDTDIWDGYDHHTGYDVYYEDITQDNIMVIASIFDEDNDDYADETIGARTGIGTDPKTFDFFFGNTTPPPLIQDNVSWFEYPPQLNWSETYYWRINVWDNNGDLLRGDIWSFTTRGNVPPSDPRWEKPINESTNVSILVNLSWICDDPDGDDVTYDVYFGDHPELNMLQVAYNQTEKWFIVEDLDFQKTYYWYVVAWDNYGLNTTGPLWHFTTEENVPPNPAEDPHPFDGDPAVPTEDVVLEWNGSDDNIGDTLSFDLYFDDVNPPTTLQMYQEYDDWWVVPDGRLEKYETYYWQVDTYDKMDEFTEGYVWSFTCGDNNPPTDPIIDGKKTGKPNEEHDFTFVSWDPENHSIWYLVEWDDGTEDKTGLTPNGTVVTLSHSWNKEGKKTIRAKAYDEHNKSSEWSEYEFTVPRNKALNLNLLKWLFNRFPNAFPIIRRLLGL